MTSRESGHDTRSRILAAARRLFAERGYAATSLADIAAEVGLTKTAVAYHFHPKDRLAAELLTPAAEDVIVLLGTDFRGDRRALLEAFVDFAVRHREVIRLIMEEHTAATPDPGTPGEAFQEFRDRLHAKLAGPGPDLAADVRAWSVMGAAQCVILHTMDLPEAAVRAELLAALLPLYAPC